MEELPPTVVCALLLLLLLWWLHRVQQSARWRHCEVALRTSEALRDVALHHSLDRNAVDNGEGHAEGGGEAEGEEGDGAEVEAVGAGEGAGVEGGDEAGVVHTDEAVLYHAVCMELPLEIRLSLEFALFRTFAIPSVSKVLHATREFEERCVRRYDDTDLLLREMLEHGLQGRTGRLAIRRMNFIHSKYVIGNDSYLYVLGVFIFVPESFLAQFGWRRLLPQELRALHSFFLRLGRNMGIRDIPPTVAAYRQWMEAHEERYMVFQESNFLVAWSTLDLMIEWIRRGVLPPVKGDDAGGGRGQHTSRAWTWLAENLLLPLARAGAAAVMDDRLRKAAGIVAEAEGVDDPAREVAARIGACRPPWWLVRLMQPVVYTLIYLRIFVVRYLCFPRSTPKRRTPEADAVDFVSGKETDVRREPRFDVYVCPYASGGYRISELGPLAVPPGKLEQIPPRWAGDNTTNNNNDDVEDNDDNCNNDFDDFH